MRQVKLQADEIEAEETAGQVGVDPTNAAANVWLIAREQNTEPVVAEAAEQLQLLNKLQDLRIKEVQLQTRRRVARELVLRSGEDWSSDPELIRLMTRDDVDDVLDAPTAE